MLNAGLIGLGGMGRGHLENLVRLTKEGEILSLKAVCDVDENKFQNIKTNFNIEGIGTSKVDFSTFKCYTSIDEMVASEKLDIVVIAIPTYLHCEAACKCLNAGINVMCEKPMSLTSEACQKMIDTAKANGKRLMIGQVLRFWGEYTVLKDLVTKNTLGRPLCAYFWRGGDTPSGSWQNWYLDAKKSGGAIQDQHIHDVDMINYLFGIPASVNSRGMIKTEGGGYGAVSTTYNFDEEMVINAQDDWYLNGAGFWMEFRISFENGVAIMDKSGFRVIKDKENITPDYNKDNAYYNEVKYFASTIINNVPNTINPPEDSMNTIKIVEAELASCDAKGSTVAVAK